MVATSNGGYWVMIAEVEGVMQWQWWKVLSGYGSVRTMLGGDGYDRR